MLGSHLTRLKLVAVGDPLPPSVLESWRKVIRSACESVVDQLDLVSYRFPSLDTIEASLLTGALAQDVGGHILAVTGADLRDTDDGDWPGFMFGGKDVRNDVAVVSTSRLSSARQTVFHERVLKVALHELGHNLGLEHHYSFEPSADGGYCPMSKGDYNGYGERGYVRAVIDGRGLGFCRRCRLALGELAKVFRSGSRGDE